MTVTLRRSPTIPSFWTMSIELIGSLLVALYLYISGKLRNPNGILYCLIGFLIAMRSFYALFFVGVLLGQFRLNGTLDQFRSSARWKIAFPVVLTGCIALIFAGRRLPAIEGHLNIVVAAVLVFAAYTSSSAIAFFSSRLSRFLGDISFPLYLVHFSLIVSFTSYWIVQSANASTLDNSRIFLIIAASITGKHSRRNGVSSRGNVQSQINRHSPRASVIWAERFIGSDITGGWNGNYNMKKPDIWPAIVVLIVACTFFTVFIYRYRFELHKVIAPHTKLANIAFIGDSITAGSGIWDCRIGKPFGTANFGENGAGLHEISRIAKARINSGSRFTSVSIMAGTNDAIPIDDPEKANRRIEETLNAYVGLIGHLQANGVKKIVVTSTPPQADYKKNTFIRKLNASLIQHINQTRCCAYIDLWPLLSDGERIRPEMTTDGVHFSLDAYEIWTSQLKNIYS